MEAIDDLHEEKPTHWKYFARCTGTGRFPENSPIFGTRVPKFTKDDIRRRGRKPYPIAGVYAQRASAFFNGKKYNATQKTIVLDEFANDETRRPSKLYYRIVREVLIHCFCQHRNILPAFLATSECKPKNKIRLYLEPTIRLEQLSVIGIPPTNQTVRFVLHCVFKAVAFLEEINIAHNNINETNVLITYVGDVKLSDFFESSLIKHEKFSISVQRQNEENEEFEEPLERSEIPRGPSNIDGDVFRAGFIAFFLLQRRSFQNKRTVQLLDEFIKWQADDIVSEFENYRTHGEPIPGELAAFLNFVCSFDHSTQPTAKRLFESPNPHPYLIIGTYECVREYFVKQQRIQKISALKSVTEAYTNYNVYQSEPEETEINTNNAFSDGKRLGRGQDAVWNIEYEFHIDEKVTKYTCILDFGNRKLLLSFVQDLFSSKNRPMLISDMPLIYARTSSLMDETYEKYSAVGRPGDYGSEASVNLPRLPDDEADRFFDARINFHCEFQQGE